MWSTLLTLLGLVVTLAGLSSAAGSTRRQHAFTFGAILLLTASLLEGSAYYIALESLVLLGSLLGYVSGRLAFKQVLLIAAAAAAVWFGPRSWSPTDVSGGVGLFAIALGFATNAPWFYILGSAIVAVRSWVAFALEPAVLPAAFGLLNTAFAVVSWRQLRSASRSQPRRRRG